jgi:hypothetical protein
MSYLPAPVITLPCTRMLVTLGRTLPVRERWRHEPQFEGFRGLLRHMVQSGRSDLAQSFGIAGESMHPQVLAAEKRMTRRSCSMPCADALKRRVCPMRGWRGGCGPPFAEPWTLDPDDFARKGGHGGPSCALIGQWMLWMNGCFVNCRKLAR